MNSTTHSDQKDEKKDDFSLKSIDIAFQEAMDLCDKQKAWRMEWYHTAQTFHNRMKFLHTLEEMDDDPAA